MLTLYQFKVVPFALHLFAAFILGAAAFCSSGCGSEPKGVSVLNAKAELQNTTDQLEALPGVRVVSIQYSDSTKEALNDLQPSAGMPFRLSGIAELEIGQDLTLTVDAGKYVDRETLDEIRETIQYYQLRSGPMDRLAEPPRAYYVCHRKGDRLSVGWRREVDFFQDPQLGKLAASVKHVELTTGDEYFHNAQTSTDGTDIGTQQGVDELNRRYRAYLSGLQSEGKQRLKDGIDQLSNHLSPDAVFTDGGNYYILKTPNDLGKFITPENFEDHPVVPFEMVWTDKDGKSLASFDVHFSLTALNRQMSGAYTLDLFNKGAGPKPQVPLFEVPKLLSSGMFGVKLWMRSDGERYQLAQVDRELEFVCWADELDQQQNLSNSELVENFHKLSAALQFIENRPIHCYFTYKEAPYAMIMKINRDPNSETGTIVTTNLATGVLTTWKIDEVRYIRSNNNVFYKADRVGERIPKAHRFDGDNDLRFHLHADGQIEFYGYKNSKTTEYKP